MGRFEIDRIAKRAAMETGQDYYVLKKGEGVYAIQPTNKPVPNDYAIVETMCAEIDLLGNL